MGSILGLGRSPGEGNGYPLQYSGLEKSMDCSPWGRKELDTTERRSLSFWEFPGGSDGKASACGAGDHGSIPGLGRSPGEGNGTPLRYSCLENSHGRRSLVGYSTWGREESLMTERLHFHFQHLQPMKLMIKPCYLSLYNSDCLLEHLVS